MRYYELLEYVLTSEFTFGFELECITKNKKQLKNLYTSIFGKNNNSEYKMNITTDVTVKVLDNNQFENKFRPYELSSDIFNVNINNISKVINFLNNLNKNEIYTNETCGFHIHLRFNNYTHKDGLWLIYNLSMDDEFLNKLTKFKKYNFFSKYADINFLNKIKEKILNNDNSLLPYNKHRVINLHPKLNTIEWRGPRDFLNEPNLNEIKDFFKLLYEFIRWISKTLAKKELNGKSKEFWTENFKDDSISSKLKSFSNDVISKREKAVNAFNNMNDDLVIKLLKYNNKLFIRLKKPSIKVLNYVRENHPEYLIK